MRTPTTLGAMLPYVGRVTTEGYNNQIAYHKRTKRLTCVEHIDNLSYNEARGMEEVGLLWFHTLNRDKSPGNINNRIHGISSKNSNYSTYMGAAYNYITNRAEESFLIFLVGCP